MGIFNHLTSLGLRPFRNIFHVVIIISVWSKITCRCLRYNAYYALYNTNQFKSIYKLRKKNTISLSLGPEGLILIVYSRFAVVPQYLRGLHF